MKSTKSISIILALFSFVSVSVFSQVMSTDEIVMPENQVVSNEGVTPYFWIGGQAVSSFGYNLETEAFGLGGADNTWTAFNVAFADSRYNPAKLTEYGTDPEMWTGHLTLKNFTMRLDGSNVDAVPPLFLAEVRGKGMHIGFVGQSGEFETTAQTSIKSGGQVLYFNDPNVTESDYYGTTNPNTTTEYSGKSIVYVGYDKTNLFKSYVTFTTEGDVNAEKEAADGFAAALDFSVYPFGEKVSYDNPFTISLTGNVLGANNYEENPLGFGTKLNAGIFIADDVILKPVIAFDGTKSEEEDLVWAAGGGLTLQFSGKRWVSDIWGENTNDVLDHFNKASSDKILKYAYAQVYGSYAIETDLDIVAKVEEPDGIAGFNENLGALVEFRMNNVLEELEGNDQSWSLISRVSYDFMDHKVSPYLRSYYDSDETFKLRTGANFQGFIPHTGWELSYTSKNLNENNLSTASADEYDMGRLEFMFIVKSDSGLISTPKSMSNWNY